MLKLILFLLCISQHCCQIAEIKHFPGNNLDQYGKYETSKKHFSGVGNISHNCFTQKYDHVKRTPPRSCRLSSIIHAIPILNKSFDYSISNFKIFSLSCKNSVTFDVATRNCEEKSPFCGGSAFSASIWSKSYEFPCYYYDNSDGSYFFHCDSFTADKFDRYFLILFLDYEHYDSFDDYYGLGGPLRYEIANISLQIDHDLACYGPTMSLNVKSSLLPLDISSIGHNKMLRFVFLGSSHARYLWDAMMFALSPKKFESLHLTNHHADARIEIIDKTINVDISFDYYVVLFFESLLDSLSQYCSLASDQSRFDAMFYVFVEVGSWNLDFNAPKYAIDSLLALFQQLRVDLSAWKTRCGNRFHIQFLSLLPTPDCLPHLPQSCLSRGHRNIYSIGAINTLLEKEIIKLNEEIHTTGISIEYLDVYSLIYPHRQEAVCHLHYLCRRINHKKESSIESTVGGQLMYDYIRHRIQQMMIA